MSPKSIYRTLSISKNVMRQIITSAAAMAFPLMVVHNGSKELWGTFVSLLLFSLISLQVINWGNKEYLLRRFSVKPSAISSDYSRILFTRFHLVLIFAILGFIIFPLSYGFFVLLWLCGRFFNHSVESLILIEKKFNSVLVIELSSFSLLSVCLYISKSNLDLHILLVFYSIYQFLKGMVYLLLFKSYLSIGDFKIDLGYFKRAYPFFLLSIFGFLASKIDVYIVERLCDTVTTSEYQIINSLLVFTMSIGAFIYTPFTKNIYRNNEEVVAKFRVLLLISGLIIVSVSLLGIYILLQYFFDFHHSLLFYAIAFIYAFPSYVYGIDVIDSFKSNREKRVVWFILSGIVTNTVLSTLFLNLNFGLIGVLAGGAVAQVLVLVLFTIKRFDPAKETAVVS